MADLWRTNARHLVVLYGAPGEDTAPAIEKAAALVSAVTRLFLHKLPDQLRIGLAIATITHQRVLATA